jgi:hypothetical protein
MCIYKSILTGIVNLLTLICICDIFINNVPLFYRNEVFNGFKNWLFQAVGDHFDGCIYSIILFCRSNARRDGQSAGLVDPTPSERFQYGSPYTNINDCSCSNRTIHTCSDCHPGSPSDSWRNRDNRSCIDRPGDSNHESLLPEGSGIWL